MIAKIGHRTTLKMFRYEFLTHPGLHHTRLSSKVYSSKFTTILLGVCDVGVCWLVHSKIRKLSFLPFLMCISDHAYPPVVPWGKNEVQYSSHPSSWFPFFCLFFQRQGDGGSGRRTSNWVLFRPMHQGSNRISNCISILGSGNKGGWGAAAECSEAGERGDMTVAVRVVFFELVTNMGLCSQLRLLGRGPFLCHHSGALTTREGDWHYYSWVFKRSYAAIAKEGHVSRERSGYACST